MHIITEPTERDVAIIRAVHSMRLLRSRDHILPLFEGRMRALVRARRLAHSSYLYRLPGRRPHEQDIFAIGNRGADLMARLYGLPRTKVDWGQQNRRLKALHTSHTLLIADIMVAIELSCRQRQIRYISQEEVLRNAPSSKGASNREGLCIEALVRWKGAHHIARIYPDRVFGVEVGGRPSYFFLEADRGTMPVRSPHLDRSSILKKMLVYRAASRARLGGATAFEELLGIRGLRTLFVAAPGAGYGGAGTRRLEGFLEANRQATKGQGSAQFLFADRSFLQAPDPLSARLLTGRGQATSLEA